jgi:hypothetical protein
LGNLAGSLVDHAAMSVVVEFLIQHAACDFGGHLRRGGFEVFDGLGLGMLDVALGGIEGGAGLVAGSLENRIALGFGVSAGLVADILALGLGLGDAMLVLLEELLGFGFTILGPLDAGLHVLLPPAKGFDDGLPGILAENHQQQQENNQRSERLAEVAHLAAALGRQSHARRSSEGSRRGEALPGSARALHHLMISVASDANNDHQRDDDGKEHGAFDHGRRDNHRGEHAAGRLWLAGHRLDAVRAHAGHRIAATDGGQACTDGRTEQGHALARGNIADSSLFAGRFILGHRQARQHAQHQQYNRQLRKLAHNVSPVTGVCPQANKTAILVAADPQADVIIFIIR